MKIILKIILLLFITVNLYADFNPLATVGTWMPSEFGKVDMGFCWSAGFEIRPDSSKSNSIVSLTYEKINFTTDDEDIIINNPHIIRFGIRSMIGNSGAYYIPGLMMSFIDGRIKTGLTIMLGTNIVYKDNWSAFIQAGYALPFSDAGFMIPLQLGVRMHL